MGDNNIIIIGTRGSKLALIQANLVKKILEELIAELETPFNSVELSVIKTKGDKILDSPLSKIGDKGLFTREIEEALFDGRIDLAVHSLKDLPTKLPDGLTIGSVLKRENPEDVLISRSGQGLADLPPGSVIGTSSLRRRAQLLSYNAGLEIADIRGNVDTRLRKLDDGLYDAIILAGAGIRRCGLEARITESIAPGIVMPAVSQGIIGIQCRKEGSEKDGRILKLLKPIDHRETSIAARVERAFLNELEGGCQVPIGCLTTHGDGDITLEGILLDVDGSQRICKKVSAPESEPEDAGRKCAHAIISAGGAAILEKLRKGC